jgi:hypothetical protein
MIPFTANIAAIKPTKPTTKATISLVFDFLCDDARAFVAVPLAFMFNGVTL